MNLVDAAMTAIRITAFAIVFVPVTVKAWRFFDDI